MRTLPEYRPSAEPLADLVARVDLPALVERYSGPGRGRGTAFTFQCPNPQHADRHPSFTVTYKGGKWLAACWSACNWRGDALALVQWLEGCDVRAAADRLRAVNNEPALDTWTGPVRRTKPAPAPVAPAELPTDTRTPSPEACERTLARYLDYRGWPSWVVDEFGLSVVLDDYGRVRVRHTFYAPVEGGGREVVAWQDRGKDPKWIGAKGVPLPLYNLPALAADLSAVVVCEGPADTISAAVALRNYPAIGAVGVAGTGGWRTEWAELLEGRTVITVADNDDAAQRLRDTMTRDLKHTRGRLVHVTPPDPLKDLTDWCQCVGFATVGTYLNGLARIEPPIESPEYLETWIRLLTEGGISVEVVK